MKKKNILLIGILLTILGIVSCNKKENIDQEGNLIKKNEIGEQVWSTENLNVAHFRNGDLIPEAKNLDEYFKYDQKKLLVGAIMNLTIRMKVLMVNFTIGMQLTTIEILHQRDGESLQNKIGKN